MQCTYTLFCILLFPLNTSCSNHISFKSSASAGGFFTTNTLGSPIHPEHYFKSTHRGSLHFLQGLQKSLLGVGVIVYSTIPVGGHPNYFYLLLVPKTKKTKKKHTLNNVLHMVVLYLWGYVSLGRSLEVRFLGQRKM